MTNHRVPASRAAPVVIIIEASKKTSVIDTQAPAATVNTV